MRHSTTLSLLGSMAIGLADAAAVSVPKSAPANLFKRWNSKLCTCDLAGVPIPDSVTFQLPLENLRQDLCYDLINPSTNAPAGKFCWDFSPNSDALTLQFKPGTDIQFNGVQVGLSTTEPSGPPPIPAAYTTDNGKCAKDASTGEISCSLLWTEITGKTALLDVLGAMCVRGDDGLKVYMSINVDMVASGQSCSAVPRPCDAVMYPDSCISTPYFQLSWRCTKCPTCDVPPVTKYCDFGTAFGYNPTYSKTLDTLSATGCKRWGWYEQVSYGGLSGMSGTLYVGAGQNDLSKATSVGTWTATVSGGKVSVTYNVNAGYSLGEVHVDVRCSLPAKCAPGQYTYGNTFATGVTTTSFTTTPIVIPCSSGNVDIIVHAAVDTVVSVPANQADTYTCPAPKNSS